jgi:hypothetical protein
MSKHAHTIVNPGICGFTCEVKAQKSDPHKVRVEILNSDCVQIQNLSKAISHISVRELFAPFTHNPVYAAAQKAGCHGSCPVPSAVLKTAEVAMDMALPKDVKIIFT